MMAGCYILHLSEVRAQSEQGRSGEGFHFVTHQVLVQLPQAALGLPLQHGSGRAKKGLAVSPTTAGQEGLLLSLMCLPTSIRAAAHIRADRPRPSDISCLYIWGDGSEGLHTGAASVGLRHLITPCRLDGGKAAVTEGHRIAQCWSVRAPAMKPRHGNPSAWLKIQTPAWNAP